MNIKANWIIHKVVGGKKTDKQSGVKLTFMQTDESLKSFTIKTSIMDELFGKLKIEGEGIDIEMQGKLMERDVYAKDEESKGERVFNFVPAMRLEADEFTALYMAVENIVQVEFEDDQKQMAFNENEAADTA